MIKLKNLLKEKNIEMGKVYTAKDKPPFKVDEKNKGLWHNIHAKRKRGEKPAKKGDKDYPKTLDIETKISEMKVNKGKVDKTYKSVLNHMRKVIKKLNDDEMYEVTTQLKKWFNKNIM